MFSIGISGIGMESVSGRIGINMAREAGDRHVKKFQRSQIVAIK